MDRSDWIGILSKTGEILSAVSAGSLPSLSLDDKVRNAAEKLESAITESFDSNLWFTPENVRYAMKAWGQALQKDKIEKWLSEYPDEKSRGDGRKIGVVMAGNIPMVGFHDMICVLASGHTLLGKLSSKDEKLMQALAELISAIDARAAERMVFTSNFLKNFDAVIATGSNNSSRYFEYYFGKYPHIIRKNRNGVAVLTGNERPGFADKLADDILMFFGLGCRNISRLWIPADYDLSKLAEGFKRYKSIADHSKYRNNYDYQKSIFIINGIPFIDNGFLLMKQDSAVGSPVSVLYYDYYLNREQLTLQLEMNRESIQCVISEDASIPGAIAAGSAQVPDLWDYADGIDTMEFLTKL